MNRIAGLSVVGALLLTGLGVAPAYADPPSSPGITLGTPTAGHITGTVTSDQPYVFVGLQPDLADRGLITLADSTSFDLPTWGYDDPAAVYASACPTDTYATDGSCSTIKQSLFTPVDVRPVLSLSDTTIGQGQAVSITSSDPDGGGVLKATWTPEVGSPTVTVLDRNGSTDLDIVDDGDGTVVVTRCAAAPVDQCTGFDPEFSAQLHVHRTVVTSVSAIATITAAHPVSTFTVTADRAGDASITWHLEKVSAPGTPVDGTGQGDQAGNVGTINGSTITEDGSYRVVGTLTLVNGDYGTYQDVPFTSDPFTVDRTGPVLTSITSSRSLLYPLIASTKYPSTTTLTATGADSGDVTQLQLWLGGTKKLTLTAPGGVTTWNGRIGSSAAPAGAYTIKAVDADGNTAATAGVVSVSGLRIVTKTWTKLVTARGSMAAYFVGKCSTLRRPSARGWAGSIGYYANTKCGKQTWSASAVTTAHAILLPSALQYVDIHVDTYGAAARKKPRSKGLIRYLTTSGNWVSVRVIGPKLGWHPGYTRSTSGVVFSDHSFGWSYAAAYGNRYDVAKFRVVLRYRALG